MLLQRDREFAKASAAHGYLAWQEFMAPNAAKPANGGRMLIGPQEIGDNMLAAFASGFTLSWEPTRAEISRGGKLGYTWGRYHSVVNGKDARRNVHDRLGKTAGRQMESALRYGRSGLSVGV